MPRLQRIETDGSAEADAERVRIDRTAEPYRWVCPNGHVDWSRTNNHVWCRSCRRQHEAGADVTPEHYEILDRKTEERLPWSAVVPAEDLR